MSGLRDVCEGFQKRKMAVDEEREGCAEIEEDDVRNDILDP